MAAQAIKAGLTLSKRYPEATPLLSTLSKKEQNALRRAFEAFDINGSWTIELPELNEIFRLLGLSHIPPDELSRKFKQLDLDGSGTIDYPEFVRMYLDIKKAHTCTPDSAADILRKRPYERTPDELRRLGYYLSHEVPFFTHLSKPLQQELARSAGCVSIEPDEWLWQQGDSATQMLALLSGTVSLWARPVGSMHADTQPDTPSAKRGPSRATSRANSTAWMMPRFSSAASTRNTQHSLGGGAESMSGLGPVAVLAPQPSKVGSKLAALLQDGAPTTSASPGSIAQQQHSGRTLPAPSFKSRARMPGQVGQALQRFRAVSSVVSATQRAQRVLLGSVSFAAVPNHSSSGLGPNGVQGSSASEGLAHAASAPSLRLSQTGTNVLLGGGDSRSRRDSLPLEDEGGRKRFSAAGDEAPPSRNSLSGVPQHTSISGTVGATTATAVDAAVAGARGSITGDVVRTSLTGTAGRPSMTGSMGGSSAGSSPTTSPRGEPGADAAAAGSSGAAKESGAASRGGTSGKGRNLLSGTSLSRRMWGKVSLAVKFSARAAAMSADSMNSGRRGPSVIKADAVTIALVTSSGEASSLSPMEDVGLDLVSELPELASELRIAEEAAAALAGRPPTTPPVFVGFCTPGTALGRQALLPSLGWPGDSVLHTAAARASTPVVALTLEGSVFGAALASVEAALAKGGGEGSSSASAFSPNFLLSVAGTPVEARTMPDAAVLVYYLSTLPSFAKLPYGLRAQLARAVIPERYARGELLMRQGDMPHAMYVLVAGTAGAFTQSRSQSQAGIAQGEASREAQAAAEAFATSTQAGPATAAPGEVMPSTGGGEYTLTSGTSTGSLHGEPNSGRASGAAPSPRSAARGATLTPVISGSGMEGEQVGEGGEAGNATRPSPRLPPGTPHSPRVSAMRALRTSNSGLASSRRGSMSGMRTSNIGVQAPAIGAARGLSGTGAAAAAADRQVALTSLTQGTAAALRAKHGQAQGTAGGAETPPTLITAQHVDAASKVAALLEGMDKGGVEVSLDTDSPHADPAGRRMFTRQISTLEGLFGPLQQQLGPGRALGELELLNMAADNTPRATNVLLKKRAQSVLALSDCSVLRVDVTTYRNTLLEARRQEVAARLAWLRECGAWAGLRQQVLLSLDASLTWMDVPRGVVLQRVGEPWRGIQMIKEGMVGVYTPPPRTCTLGDLQDAVAAQERKAAEVEDAGGPSKTQQQQPQQVQRLSFSGALPRSLSSGQPDVGRMSLAGTGAIPSAANTNGTAAQGTQRLGSMAAAIPGASLYGAAAALKPVTLLGPSDFLGEDALLHGGVHAVSVVSETACRVAVLRPADVAVLGQGGVAQLVALGRLREEWRGEHAVRGPDEFMGTAAAAAGTGDAANHLSSTHTLQLGRPDALRAAIAALPCGGLMAQMVDAATAGRGAPKSARAQDARTALLTHGPAAMAAAIVRPRPRACAEETKALASRPREAYMRPKSTNAQAMVLKSSSAAAAYMEIDPSVYGRWMDAAERHARTARLRAALDAHAAGHEDEVQELMAAQSTSDTAQLSSVAAVTPHLRHSPRGTMPSTSPQPLTVSTPYTSTGATAASAAAGSGNSHTGGPALLTAGWSGAPAGPYDPGHTFRTSSVSAAGTASEVLEFVLPPDPAIPGREPLVMGVRKPRFELADKELTQLPRPAALLQVLQPVQVPHVVTASDGDGAAASGDAARGPADGAQASMSADAAPALVSSKAVEPGDSPAGLDFAEPLLPPLPLPTLPIVPPLQLPLYTHPAAAPPVPQPTHVQGEGGSELVADKLPLSPHPTATSVHEGHSVVLDLSITTRAALTPVHEADDEGHRTRSGSTCAHSQASTGPHTPLSPHTSKASIGSEPSEHQQGAQHSPLSSPPSSPAPTTVCQEAAGVHEDAALAQAQHTAEQVASHDASSGGSAHRQCSGSGIPAAAPQPMAPDDGRAVRELLDEMLDALPQQASVSHSSDAGAAASIEEQGTAEITTGPVGVLSPAAHVEAAVDVGPHTTKLPVEMAGDPVVSELAPSTAETAVEGDHAQEGVGGVAVDCGPDAPAAAGVGPVTAVTVIPQGLRESDGEEATAEHMQQLEPSPFAADAQPVLVAPAAGNEDMDITPLTAPSAAADIAAIMEVHVAHELSMGHLPEEPQQEEEAEGALAHDGCSVVDVDDEGTAAASQVAEGAPQAAIPAAITSAAPLQEGGAGVGDADVAAVSKPAAAAPVLEEPHAAEPSATQIDAPSRYDEEVVAPQQSRVLEVVGEGQEEEVCEEEGSTGGWTPSGPPTLVWVQHAHPPVRPVSALLSPTGRRITSPRTRMVRGDTSPQARGGGALSGPPLLPQPPHMMPGATSCAIALSSHMLLPGIRAAVGGGGGVNRSADDPLVRTKLPAPARDTLSALRGARPFSALHSRHPAYGTATSAAATRERVTRITSAAAPPLPTGKAPPLIHTGTRPRVTRDSIWDPLIGLDYPHVTGRPGSLATGFHYSSADLTSFRWRPEEPAPSQAAFTTRSQLLAMAIEKDAAALLGKRMSEV